MPCSFLVHFAPGFSMLLQHIPSPFRCKIISCPKRAANHHTPCRAGRLGRENSGSAESLLNSFRAGGTYLRAVKLISELSNSFQSFQTHFRAFKGSSVELSPRHGAQQPLLPPALPLPSLSNRDLSRTGSRHLCLGTGCLIAEMLPQVNFPFIPVVKSTS